MSRTLQHLKQLNASWPLARKMLVGPDLRWGRELLSTLAREEGGWVGWEAVTPKAVAGELAFASIAERGEQVGSDLQIAARSEAALEATLQRRQLTSRLARLVGRPGIRTAVHDAVQSLRASGLSGAEVRQRAPTGSTAGDLGRILEAYVGLLREQRLLDPADLFRLALDAFDEEAPFVLAPQLVVAGELSLRGLRGRLVRRLLERGAVSLQAGGSRLPAPPLVAASLAAPVTSASGGPSPSPAIFCAVSPAIELREVLRRALAAGLSWGDIEIAATSEDDYGVEMEALTSHLGIPCTLRNGLPFSRSALGRAVARFRDFLSDGLPSDVLRTALESGELKSPDDGVTSSQLARRLRELNYGWGRERLERACESLSSSAADRLQQHEDENPEEFAERAALHDRVSRALQKLLGDIIDLLPPVPERGDFSEVRMTPAMLAASVRRYVGLLSEQQQDTPEAAGHAHLRDRLLPRLEELERLGLRETTFAGALAEVEAVFNELRAWPRLHGRAGASAGDAVHFTSITHAGLTGRQAIFVVGLDSERVAGKRVQDALLSDTVRLQLDPEALPTLASQQEEHGWRVESSLASLTSGVTFSWAVRGSGAGGYTGPAHHVLEAFRRGEGSALSGYEDLRNHLGEPASAVPPDGALLDARDVWLAAIADGPLLLDGSAQVREAFSALDRGLALRSELSAHSVRPVHGVIANPAGLDPAGGARPVSASQLETLARCPLAWLYRYGIGLRVPDEPEYDPDAWLQPRERGLLLHKLYELFGREYAGRRDQLHSDTALERLEAITGELIDEWREKIPPPSEAVFTAEVESIHLAARRYLALERADADASETAEPFAFELEVEFGDPVELPLAGRTLRVHGRIDRVDRYADGSLRVIDFKTGNSYGYLSKSKEGPFHGGRHLQAGIYSAIAERKLGAQVRVFEYRFPTPKGGNEVASYPEEELARTSEVVAGLLDDVRSGNLLPTNNTDDCKFCDAAPICRVKLGDFYSVDSAPRAEWAEQHASRLEEFRRMVARRNGA